jgi:hypothetical protein
MKQVKPENDEEELIFFEPRKLFFQIPFQEKVQSTKQKSHRHKKLTTAKPNQ